MSKHLEIAQEALENAHLTLSLSQSDSKKYEALQIVGNAYVALSAHEEEVRGLVRVLRYAVDNPEFNSEVFDAMTRAILAKFQGEKE
jgi:hypothetical protein